VDVAWLVSANNSKLVWKISHGFLEPLDKSLAGILNWRASAKFNSGIHNGEKGKHLQT
jgi:hypothetical protein